MYARAVLRVSLCAEGPKIDGKKRNVVKACVYARAILRVSLCAEGPKIDAVPGGKILMDFVSQQVSPLPPIDSSTGFFDSLCSRVGGVARPDHVLVIYI